MHKFITPIVAVLVVAVVAAAFWPSGARESVELTFDALPRLENGFFYEGWVVVDGEPWSVGQYNVAKDGSLVTVDGEPLSGGMYDAGFDIGEATMYAITYHPPGDTTGAAAPHVLGGMFEDGLAVLTLESPAGMNMDLKLVAGLYIMEEDEPAKLTFRVPQLAPGYRYEAWLVTDGTDESLGQFGGADFVYGGAHTHDHGAGVTVEPTEALIHEIELASDPRGKWLVLTLEHAPDDSPEPSGMRLLEARVSASAENGVQYQLANPAQALPTGTAKLR